MQHNLIRRYHNYLQQLGKLKKLQEDLARNSTHARVQQYEHQSRTLANTHLNVMAAIYERTKLHAHMYRLDPLVKRFRGSQGMRKRIFNLRTRLIEDPRNDKLQEKLNQLIAENQKEEYDLMADAMTALERILDLENRNE